MRKRGTRASTAHDYLAIIPIGGGSSWGRSSNKKEAVETAVGSLRDWSGLFDVSEIEITVNVIDVRGYDQCSWGGYPGGYVHGKNEKTGSYEPIHRAIEHVKRTTPRWGKRKAA